MPRFVALLRVSTRGQLDGYGLDAQRDAVEAWAKANRHRLVAVYVDEGVSGAAPLGERAGLRDALLAVSQERADGIVVPRLDRLARDVILQEQLFAEITSLGGRLASTVAAEDAHLTHDPDDPTRALVRRILGAIADYERQLIRLRLTGGINRKRAAGGYFAGQPPYGWQAIGKTLVPFEPEQIVRRQIKAWVRNGWSARRIADELNRRGVPTKNGGAWHPMTVARIAKYKKRAISPGSAASAGLAFPEPSEDDPDDPEFSPGIEVDKPISISLNSA